MSRTDLDAKMIIAALQAGEPMSTLAARLNTYRAALWAAVARDHPDMAGVQAQRTDSYPGTVTKAPSAAKRRSASTR